MFKFDQLMFVSWVRVLQSLTEGNDRMRSQCHIRVIVWPHYMLLNGVQKSIITA